jgi:cytochrome c553
MRGLIDDLRQVDTMLAAGRLDEARALAFMLSRPVRDPRLTPYGAEYERVSNAALALASATSFEEAYRLAPRVVAACAGCHHRAGVTVAALDQLGPVFERVSKR